MVGRVLWPKTGHYGRFQAMVVSILIPTRTFRQIRHAGLGEGWFRELYPRRNNNNDTKATRRNFHGRVSHTRRCTASTKKAHTRSPIRKAVKGRS